MEGYFCNWVFYHHLRCTSRQSFLRIIYRQSWNLHKYDKEFTLLQLQQVVNHQKPSKRLCHVDDQVFRHRNLQTATLGIHRWRFSFFFFNELCNGPQCGIWYVCSTVSLFFQDILVSPENLSWPWCYQQHQTLRLFHFRSWYQLICWQCRWLLSYSLYQYLSLL